MIKNTLLIAADAWDMAVKRYERNPTNAGQAG